MMLHFTITPEDYLQYNLFHQKHSKTVQRQLLLLRCLFPLLMLLLALLFTLGLHYHPIVAAGIPAVAALVWVLVLPGAMQRALKRNVARIMKQGKRNEFIGPRTLVMGDATIRQEGSGQASEIAYNLVESVQQDEGRYYLYIGAISAIVVPFTAFHSPQEMQAFRALVQQKTGL